MATEFHPKWSRSSALHAAWDPGWLANLPTALPWAFWPTKMVWTILLPILVMNENKAHCFALSWFGAFNQLYL